MEGSEKSLKIYGERVYLKPIQKTDVKLLYQLRREISHPDRVQFSDLNEAAHYLDRIVEGMLEGRWYYWCINSLKTKKSLGIACLWNFSDYESIAEIGYELLPEHRRKGYASESAKLTLNFGFKFLGLLNILGCVSPKNLKSIQVLENLGFQLGGILKDENQLVYRMPKTVFLKTSPTRAHEYGLEIGRLNRGPLNKITDVAGLKVGHMTLINGATQTGVTVLVPSKEDVFSHKLISSTHVINGFGKSSGLVQIEELGTLESPIALTNTLSVGAVTDAMIGHMLRTSSEDIRSINCVVGECNDGFLNDIKHRLITHRHVEAAFKNAVRDFEEGAIGAGRGMSCHQLKGGIGSSSRQFEIGEVIYTLGVMVLSNHGILDDLQICGVSVGSEIAKKIEEKSIGEPVDRGSCMILVATDLPVLDRQLKRILKRASGGLARLGSYMGHGSGEIVIGFSTANSIEHRSESSLKNLDFIRDDRLDIAFRAVVECTEEACLNSMLTSERVEGVEGHVREPLSNYMDVYFQKAKDLKNR